LEESLTQLSIDLTITRDHLKHIGGLNKIKRGKKKN